LFDNKVPNEETLGFRFLKDPKTSETNDILKYFIQTFTCLLKAQGNVYNHDLSIKERTVDIHTEQIYSLDFDISDEDYNFLLNQGYMDTKFFLQKKNIF